MQPEAYEKQKEETHIDRVTELAQKLYNDDGYAGNLYKTNGRILQIYESKAIDILESENVD